MNGGDAIIRCNRFNNAGGFTLVELLIALLISMLVAAALATAYQANQRVKSVQDQVVEMQQNLRGAFFLLQRELRMAGLDRLETAGAGIVAATRNRITFTQDIDPAGPPPGDGKKIKDPPDVPAERVSFGFSVAEDADGDGVADNGFASLRKEIGAGGMQPVADNLVAIEFCYRLNNMSSTDPCIIAPATGEFDRIRAVTVTMLVRAANPDSNFRSGGQTFQTASGQQWVMPNDQFRRKMLISNIQLRNMDL